MARLFISGRVFRELLQALSMRRFLHALLEYLRLFLPERLKSTLRPIGGTSVVRRWLNTSFPYEPDVCSAIERIVQPGWICADVGAHVGAITQLLAKLVGSTGVVVAFEAHPENAQVLRETTRINGWESRVRVENLAVSDGSCDHLWLCPGRWRSSAEWNIVGHDVEGRKTEPELKVAATSLDAYFPPGSRLNFVKMDVEGAEALVLAGMKRLLRQTRPVVLIEFHDESGWAGRRELFAAGYHIYGMSGERLDLTRGAQRAYHCLALPMEMEARGLEFVVRKR